MYRKGIALAAAIAFIGILATTGGVGLGAPQPLVSAASASASATATATATASPQPTSTATGTETPADTAFPPLSKDATLKPSGADGVVTISDSKLKTALHTATGVASGTSIRKSDLAKLIGGLDLTGKGIANISPLQYCENITALNLTDNKVTDLPSSFSKLKKLTILIVDDNKLTKMNDSLFALTALKTLSMKGNTIEKISDKIGSLIQLTDLDLSNNKKISAMPTNVSKLTRLVNLNLSGNNFRTISREAFLLPNLVNLDLSNNVLKELPKEAASTPKLVKLNVKDNILDSLPAGIGSAPSLLEVDASINRLTIIEPTLLNGKIQKLDLDVNRITELPTGLMGKTFDLFQIEWNFIDMSEGSKAREVADSVNAAGGKAYLRQLKFLPLPEARPTTTTVFLQWQPIEDGSDGDATWKVNKYQIYIDNNGTWGNPIGELDRLATAYVATSLKADKSYKFQVGVEYKLTIDGRTLTHRYFTPVETKTLSASATAAPTVEATVEPAPTDPGLIATAEPTDQAPEPTDKAQNTSGGGSKSLLAIIVIVGAVLVLAIGGVLAFSMARRNKRPY